jgi:hypothetical protein
MYEQDFNTFWPELVTGYLTGNYAIADYESHLERKRQIQPNITKKRESR